MRTYPASRANPQFNQEALRASLADAGIAYTHAPALGGRRPRQAGADPAVNAAWEHAAFRNFADYARGPEFGGALDELVAGAARARCAIMCSEAVWWRCHRRIITDYLLVRGCPVRHILSPTKAEAARLTPFARPASDGTVAYPAAEHGLFERAPEAP